ncbi:MAG: 2-dehydropantoate 2-reductase [Actinomycetota bacterium]
MRIAILGAGAIGGITGGMMALAGEDVTLVDTFAEHVDAINSNGLRIIGELGEHLVRVPAVAPAELSGEFDLVFLAVKGVDTDEALRLLGPHTTGRTPVVSLQNGINEEHIADLIGAERTIGASTHYPATLEGPGLVNKTGPNGYVVGELDGRITDRVMEVGRLLALVDVTEVTDNIRGHLWSKLMINVCTNSFGALSGQLFGEFVVDETNKKLLGALYTESYDVARAQGIDMVKLLGVMDPELITVRSREDAERVLPMLDALGAPEMFGRMKSSMLQDIERGRRTEIDYLNGFIVDKGAEVGVPTPVNRAIVEMVRQVEAGIRPLTPDNLTEIWESVKNTVPGA